MIDLHIHSNCSDGSDDWKSILQKAERLGLSCISITDHDNCEVYTQMENPRDYFSGRVVVGIEMQAYFDGIAIELLGYGFDLPTMQERLKGLYLPFAHINEQELFRLHALCAAQGMRFAPDVPENYADSGCFYATEYLHNEMRKYPENQALVPDTESWASEHIFFKRHTSNPNSAFYVDESDLLPSAARVAQIIHEAGGKVFIPHVFEYEKHAQNVLAGLCESCVIDGVECYYPSFTPKQTAFLLDFCAARGLLVSGGSDYHGANRPANEMGCVGEFEMFSE